MSNNKMLIDATHPEETRVVVLHGGRVEEFDYESAARKLLRGNIYLAKITRVEPSLQAAFVEYGGNRHGFLAFNEIHPDYYQIPMADRQALLDEEAAAEAEEEAYVDAQAEARAQRGEEELPEESEPPEDLTPASSEPDEAEDRAEVESAAASPPAVAADVVPADEILAEPAPETEDASAAAVEVSETELGVTATKAAPAAVEAAHEGGLQEVDGNGGEPESVEQVGTEDALEELPSRPRRRPRSYKIQEVIKRRQVILVQVVKEERGNKGAALTTYLSLAGRYTVLMPNTARGGGISRKITNPADRKRLKAIAADLEVPEGMGLIIRTAGAARTKQEIKRDFEYLLRLWESVRDLTLQSQAPSLVYEEGNLIKRSIRDLYNKDVEEIVVAGGDAHREAKDFMRMLMPSHAKNVIEYKEPEPLFTRYQIERQLNAMFSPYVTLRSGGYLVINQTEALVAIDVNSGKSTREFSIEETALNTNIEAADEIARQLKLRDLAGLIVIDFIDMEEKRNNRAVERRLKDALRFDRARIQVGRISHFGLLEMSRQRLRTGVLEGSTSQCPHCQGTGIIRSTESVALAVLRALEDAVLGGAKASLVATTTPTVALYILNNKRAFINAMEARHGYPVVVQGSDKMQGATFAVEKGAVPAQPQRRPERSAVKMDWGFDGEESEDEVEVEGDIEEIAAEAEDGGDAENGRGEDGGRRRRRRRRRGRRGERLEPDSYRAEGVAETEDDEEVADQSEGELEDEEEATEGEGALEAGEGGSAEAGDGERRGRRGRRRGRRGGRRGRERLETAGMEPAAEPSADEVELAMSAPDDEPHLPREPSSEQPGVPPTEEAAAGAENGREPVAEPRAPEKTAEQPREREQVVEASGAAVAQEAEEPSMPPPPPRPRAAPTASEPRIERVVVRPEQGTTRQDISAETAEAQPPRKGWWQRKFGGA